MSRRTTWLIVAAALLVGVGVAVVDLVVPPVDPPEPTPVATSGDPVAGTWVCPVGDARDDTTLQASVARPPTAGSVPSQVEMHTLRQGERTTELETRLFPEAAATRRLEAGDGAAVAVDWRDGPAVVHREWTLTAEGGQLPPGIVAGGCVEPFSDRWIVPGMATSGGAQALLRIANPFPTDATIAIGFVAPEGPLQPLALRNLSVEGRGTLEIDVNEFLPERPDLAAVVTVASGRVGVEGYQLVRSAIGGVDGVSALAAAPEPAETWTVPWIVDGDDLASWLWVYNPGDRQALLELTYHTPDGGIVPEGLGEVSVDPGQLRRVDLRGTLPADVNVVALSARSDGAPVVLSAATELRSDDTPRSGFAVQLGTPDAADGWTVGGGPTQGRLEQLHLSNPTGEPASVSVALFTGVTVQRPEPLQELTLAPGAQRVVDLTDLLGTVDDWTAFVTASSGEVVVGRVGSANEGARNLVVAPGVPSSAWRAPGSGLGATWADGLVTRFATLLGIQRDDALPEVPEAPTPPLGPDGEGPAIDELPELSPEDVPGDDAEVPDDLEVPDPDDLEVPDPEDPDADGADGADDPGGEDDPDDADDEQGSEDGGPEPDGEPSVGATLDQDLFGRGSDG